MECSVPGGLNNSNIGDGFCNGGLYASAACDFDGGDCNTSCSTPPDSSTNTYSVKIADVNVDGYKDIVIGNTDSFSTSHPNKVLFGNGTGIFEEMITFTFSSGSVYDYLISLEIADFDNDGFPDVIAYDTGGILLLLNDGEGTFQDDPIEVSLTDCSSVAIADYNQDGSPDIACLTWDGIVEIYMQLSTSLFARKGKIAFKSAIILEDEETAPPDVFFEGTSIIAIDLNGDEAPEILTGSWEKHGTEYSYRAQGGKVKMFVNKGDGTFHLPKRLRYTTTGTVNDIVAGDIDNDGIIDIVSGGDGHFESILGRNDGLSFSRSRDMESLIGYGRIGQIYLVDMNNDGNLDIVLEGAGVRILIGNGDGTFKKAVEVSCPGSSYHRPGSATDSIISIAVSDMDRDGFPDLIIGNIGSKNQILMNLGDGI